MPVVARMDLPRPADWQEFEAMTADAMRLKWSSPNLQMNGRPGQEQFGVDISGPDDLGRPTAVQCKLTRNELTMSIIRAELEKAETFGSPLSTVYMATTLPFDSHLQREVRVESLTRCQAGRSAVGILFWGDVVDGLVLNPAVFRNYYPQIDLAGAPRATSFERIMWCVELGFFGPYLWKYVELIMGEFGWMANEDPDQLRVTMELVETHASRILPENSAERVRLQVAELTDALFPENGAENFDKAKLLCGRVAQRVRQVLTTVPPTEAQSLRLGMRLGAATLADGDMSSEEFDAAVAVIHSLLGQPSAAIVDQEAAGIRGEDTMHRPSSLFNLVLREATRRALG